MTEMTITPGYMIPTLTVEEIAEVRFALRDRVDYMKAVIKEAREQGRVSYMETDLADAESALAKARNAY